MSTPTTAIPNGYPQLDFLNVTQSVQVPSTHAAGPHGPEQEIYKATICFTVPQGQWWVPKWVKVAIATSNNPGTTPAIDGLSGQFPFCEVYYGQPQANSAVVSGNIVSGSMQQFEPGSSEVSSLVDWTIRGDKDVSGIIAGTVLPPGTAILISWYHVMPVTPDPVYCMAQVVGSACNVPPASVPGGLTQMVPQTPGPAFTNRKPLIDIAPSWHFDIGIPTTPNSQTVLLTGLPPRFHFRRLSWGWAGQDTGNGSTGFFAFVNTGGTANPTMSGQSYYIIASRAGAEDSVYAGLDAADVWVDTTAFGTANTTDLVFWRFAGPLPGVSVFGTLQWWYLNAIG